MHTHAWGNKPTDLTPGFECRSGSWLSCSSSWPLSGSPGRHTCWIRSNCTFWNCSVTGLPPLLATVASSLASPGTQGETLTYVPLEILKWPSNSLQALQATVREGSFMSCTWQETCPFVLPEPSRQTLIPAVDAEQPWDWILAPQGPTQCPGNRSLRDLFGTTPISTPAPAFRSNCRL